MQKNTWNSAQTYESWTWSGWRFAGDVVNRSDYWDNRILPAKSVTNPRPRGCLLCPHAQISKNKRLLPKHCKPAFPSFSFQQKPFLLLQGNPIFFSPFSSIPPPFYNFLPPPLTSRSLILINDDILGVYGGILFIMFGYEYNLNNLPPPPQTSRGLTQP